MAHVRGHILKMKRLTSDTESHPPRTGDFHTYHFSVTNYNDLRPMIEASDSYEDRYGRDILFLSESRSIRKGEIDIVLKTQNHFDFANDWTFEGKNNWLVYDEDDQEEGHHHD